MMRFLVVSENPERLKGLSLGLMKEPQVEVHAVTDIESALNEIAGKTPALVIVDDRVFGMEGKVLIEQMIKRNPMVNTALVSGLSDEDFHEYTEGLGVLMPVSMDAGDDTAVEMLEKIKKLYSLYQS